MRRDVHITLTPYAPGCGALPIRAERRVLSLYAVEPGQAVRELVERLERPPSRSSAAASRSSGGSMA